MADLGAQHKTVASDDGATVTTTDGGSYKKIGNFFGYPGMSLYTHDGICYGNLETGGGAGTGIRSKSGIPVINQYDPSKNGIIATSDVSFDPIRGLKTAGYDKYFVNNGYNSYIGNLSYNDRGQYVVDADFDKNGNLLEFVTGYYNHTYAHKETIYDKSFTGATGDGIALTLDYVRGHWESNVQQVSLSPTGWDLVGFAQSVMYGRSCTSHSSWEDTESKVVDIDQQEYTADYPVIAGNGTIDLKGIAAEAEDLCRRGMSEIESKHPPNGRLWPPIEKPEAFVSSCGATCYYGRVFSDGSWYAFVNAGANGWAYPYYSWQDCTISTYKTIKSWRMSSDVFAGIQGEYDFRTTANTFTATRWRKISISSSICYLVTSNGMYKLSESYGAYDPEASYNDNNAFYVTDYTPKEENSGGYFITAKGGWAESCFGLLWDKTGGETETSISIDWTSRKENLCDGIGYSTETPVSISMPIGGGYTARGIFSYQGQMTNGTVYDPDGKALKYYTDQYIRVLGQSYSPGITAAKVSKGTLILDSHNIYLLNKEGSRDQETSMLEWKLPYGNANYRLCRMNRSKFVQQNRDPNYNPNTGSGGGGSSL